MASVKEIEEKIIGALATQKGCSAAELRSDLLAKGSDMPADSHRLVRAVVKIQRELGIKIKWDKSLRPALKSVKALAQLLHERQGQARKAA
ncbi:MAG TPA: hypothetical protein VFN92_07995 [Solirubrobacterales bacterium]|jgi:acyl carrier protein|nr:hypothetical protein [Solirubrobacterales bacterium]